MLPIQQNRSLHPGQNGYGWKEKRNNDNVDEAQQQTKKYTGNTTCQGAGTVSASNQSIKDKPPYIDESASRTFFFFEPDKVDDLTETREFFTTGLDEATEREWVDAMGDLVFVGGASSAAFCSFSSARTSWLESALGLLRNRESSFDGVRGVSRTVMESSASTTSTMSRPLLSESFLRRGTPYVAGESGVPGTPSLRGTPGNMSVEILSWGNSSTGVRGEASHCDDLMCCGRSFSSAIVADRGDAVLDGIPKEC
jgi:hypothetical protein